MQQTEKYKLNLIEKDDPFSPDALNQNMEKVEGALAAVTAHADAGDQAEAAARAALAQRVIGLEGKTVAIGTYIGDGAKGGQHIQLGFTPAAILFGSTSSLTVITSAQKLIGSLGITLVMIEEGGFYINADWNNTGLSRHFIAFPS